MSKELQKLHDEMLDMIRQQQDHIEHLRQQLDIRDQIVAKQDTLLKIKEEQLDARTKTCVKHQIVLFRAIFSIPQN